MGELGIVSNDFARTKLVEMAKYRNRLVHFYAEVTAKELHGLIGKDLEDFHTFLSAIKQLLAHPETFGLTVE